MNLNVFGEEDFPLERKDETPATVPTPTVVSPAATSEDVSFENLSPVPTMSRPSKTSNRKQHSTVITATPQKEVLLAKKQKREQKTKSVKRPMNDEGEEKRKGEKEEKENNKKK